MGERLEPRPPPRRRLAHALRHRPDPPVVAGQQGDDAVGLPQLVGAQHDRLVAVERHLPHSARAHPVRRGAATTAARRASSQQASANLGAMAFSRSGRAATPGRCGPPRTARSASPRPAWRRRRTGGSGRSGARRPGPAVIARRCFDCGATRPKMMPWMTAATEAGRWSRVSSPMPAQNGTSPRGIGRVRARTDDTVHGRYLARTSAARTPRSPRAGRCRARASR